MVRGHIYLHPSLTEAFGTVIVEAASCGLYVVCTQVGGIPEVLPSHMTVFARPEEDDIVAATGRAIAALRANKVRTERFHDQVRAMYSWTNVAERTERVYNGISGDISEREFYGGSDRAAWSASRGRSGVQSFRPHRPPQALLRLRHLGRQALLPVRHRRLPHLPLSRVLVAPGRHRHLPRLAAQDSRRQPEGGRPHPPTTVGCCRLYQD